MSLSAQPARLNTTSPDFEAQFAARLHWSADTDQAIEQRVADILADVKARGDAAVLEYTARFDGLQAASMAELELTQADFKTAFDGLPAAQREALQSATRRVRSYHEAQKKASTAKPLPEFGSPEDFQLAQALNRLKGKPVLVSKTIVERKAEASMTN